jgi:serine/threonine-protein kinase
MINHVPGRAMVGAALSIVCAATVFGSGNAVAAPPRFALPACYGSDTPPTERPDQVGFQTCADGSKDLTDLKWSSWGPRGADATGIYSHQVCEPNCAAGHRVSFQAVIHADEPQAAAPESGCPADTKFYSNLVVAFPNNVPDHADSPTNMRYQGMPAVVYSTVGDPSAPTSLGSVRC